MGNISTTCSLQDEHGGTVDEQTCFNLTDAQKSFAHINNIIYYSFLFPVAILGNIFTLSAVFMVLKIKKSIPNILIGSLAFADLTSVFTCHLIAVISMSNQQSVGGDNLCRFQSVMGFTYFKLGFFSKTCISIDRLIALKYPLKYRSIVTRKRVIWIIVIFTVFSIGTSSLTWILDPEHIFKLETWYMCTNDFSEFTIYKLLVVIGEGTVFLGGVVIFFIGNITVIKVMLDLGSKMKKLKERDNTLSKLKLVPLSVVTRASAGFTDMATISERDECDDSNNNRKEESDVEEIDELHTPLSRRAKNKLYGEKTLSAKGRLSIPNGNQKHSNGQANHSARRLSVPETKLNRLTTGDQFQKNSSPPSAKKGHNGVGGKERKKSIFKRVVELSSKAKAKKKESRQKKELQFAKLVMVIVTVFVILWIPYMVRTQ